VRCIDPHILGLGISWRGVDSFTSRPLYFHRKQPLVPVGWMAGWAPEPVVEGTKILSLWELELRPLGRPVRIRTNQEGREFQRIPDLVADIRRSSLEWQERVVRNDQTRITVKKVKLSLCLISKHHAMKTYRGSSTILYLSTGWRWVVSFTPPPRYPLDNRLGDPRAGLNTVEYIKTSCLCRESNPGNDARSLLLQWLSYPGPISNKGG
jgi:hypothetical protein